VLSGTEEAMSEANISAEQPEAIQEARLPAPDVDPGGTGHPAGPAAEGSKEAVGLIWRIRDRRTFAAFGSGRSGGRTAGSSRARIGPVTVSFVDSNPAEPPRVAFSISRKVGSAVERNRLRRRLRAILRDLAPPLRPGAYLIGVAPPATQLPFGELRTTVMQAIEVVGDTDARKRVSASRENP